jgi:phytoene dehydrogenase-like protein
VRGRPEWSHGPNGLATLLEDLARESHVTIRTETEVARVEVDNDAVTGIVLRTGEQIAARTVLSTLDPVHTLLRLIDPVWLDPEFLLAVKNIKLRGARATAVYALDTLPHALINDGVTSLTGSSRALEQAYDAAKYGLVSDQLHIEFCVPSLLHPDTVPKGKAVVVAHAQYVPWLPGGRSDGDQVARRVTDTIEQYCPGFSSSIRESRFLTPNDLAERYLISEGAVTHGELTLDLILFMRPVAGWARYASPVSGLYLGGAGTHPGPGVMGGPGWLAARAVLKGVRGR